MKKALIVVTNIAKYDNLDRPTGAWFSEVTHFAKDFYDAGYDVDFVSPNGGYVPLDPISLNPEMMGAEDWEYYTDHDYMNKFGQTLSPKEVNPSYYQAIYFAGGHGAIWDFRNNKELNDIALSIYNNQGVLSSVCHGAAGLLDIKENGDYLVRHKDVTGFTNSDFAVVDGRIVTGQNPQSGHAVAEHALKILANQ